LPGGGPLDGPRQVVETETGGTPPEGGQIPRGAQETQGQGDGPEELVRLPASPVLAHQGDGEDQRDQGDDAWVEHRLSPPLGPGRGMAAPAGEHSTPWRPAPAPGAGPRPPGLPLGPFGGYAEGEVGWGEWYGAEPAAKPTPGGGPPPHPPGLRAVAGGGLPGLRGGGLHPGPPLGPPAPRLGLGHRCPARPGAGPLPRRPAHGGRLRNRNRSPGLRGAAP